MSDPRNPNQNQRGRDNDPRRDPSRQIDPAAQDRANMGGRTGEAGHSSGNPRKDQPMQGDKGRKEGWIGDKPRKQDEPAGKKHADSMPDKSGKRAVANDDDDGRYSHRKDAQG